MGHFIGSSEHGVKPSVMRGCGQQGGSRTPEPRGLRAIAVTQHRLRSARTNELYRTVGAEPRHTPRRRS